MKSKFYGVWPTMIGAFDDNGNVDLSANKQIARYLIDHGAHGLFALCQSTEMFYFTLEEKIRLIQAILEEVNHQVPVIVSGHTSDSLEDQIKELSAIAKTNVDAIVLVSNRLDIENQGTDIFIKNLQSIFDALPDVTFGIYECPYPYLRLLSDEEVQYLVDSKRCVFIKDVSCNEDIQKRRAAITRGSTMHLFNANTDTLLSSLRNGYAGYNGVMGNFHIDLYRWLYENKNVDTPMVDALQKELTQVSKIEQYSYPVNAKYHMKRDGVNLTLASRRMNCDSFSDSDKEKVHHLEKWERETRALLKGSNSHDC